MANSIIHGTMINAIIHDPELLTNRLSEAISLLKLCVNYDNKPMTAAICGETGDKVREFIRRCEEND